MNAPREPHFEKMVHKSKDLRLAEAFQALRKHEERTEAAAKAAQKEAIEAEHARLVADLAPQIAESLGDPYRAPLRTRVIRYDDFGPYSKLMNAGKTKKADRYLDEKCSDAWPMDFIPPLPGTAAMPTPYRYLLLGTEGQIYESRNAIDPRNMRQLFVAEPYTGSATPALEGLANMAYGYNLIADLELHDS